MLDKTMSEPIVQWLGLPRWGGDTLSLTGQASTIAESKSALGYFWLGAGQTHHWEKRETLRSFLYAEQM